MTLTIRNARIVDGTADRPSDPCDIIIENGRIREIAAAGSFTSGDSIDAEGHVVMPGLIDCHVHVIASTANLGQNAHLPNSLVAAESGAIMRAMLMRGFTTVRDLGGADIGLVQAVERGLFTGPRLVICGKALSQTGGHTDYRGPYSNRDVGWYADRLGSLGRIVDGVDACRRAAREELKSGAQFIKIMADGGVSSPSDPIGYQAFSREEITAIVEVAKGAGTYVSAHLYDDAAINRALDCGVECVEHGNLVSAATARRIAKMGAVVVPTTVTYDVLGSEGPAYGLPPESVAKVEDVRSAGFEALTHLHGAGVTIGFGTDLLGGMMPHQSREFELRGRYLPAQDVIRSATLDAAKVLRMEGQVGQLVAGAHADLIFVKGDPLQDLALLGDQGAHIPLILKGGTVVKRDAHI